MIVAGIDCGARNIKVVIHKDGEIISKSINPTGLDPGKDVLDSLDNALRYVGLGIDHVEAIGATGKVVKDMRQSYLEIPVDMALSKAVHHMFPYVRTVIDVGAEESRALKLDEKGNVVDFVINERCAASAGAYMEAMAKIMEITTDHMGSLYLKASKKEAPINSQCVIFAEYEVENLVFEDIGLEEICKSILDAMATRIVSMTRRVGINREVAILGGCAKNKGFVEAMKRQLNLEQVFVPPDPEFAMAMGAALIVA